MRAPKSCGERLDGGPCPHAMPCPLHKPTPWRRETPRSRLSGSRQQKRSRFVIDRDNGLCHVCGYAGADQADHVIPISEDGPDNVSNMAAIHAKPCHEEKTLAEAARARTRGKS